MKILKKGATFLFPVPAVLVSCKTPRGKTNIITISWTGVMASDPPLIHISVRPSRFSNEVIKKSCEFVINIPTQSQLEKVDYCGMHSGKNIDKFQACGFTKEKAKYLNVPLIKECPINLECKVIGSLDYGSHTIFIGEVLCVHLDKKILDEKGRVSIEKLDPIAFCPMADEYYALGEFLGKHGISKTSKSI